MDFLCQDFYDIVLVIDEMALLHCR